MRVIRADHVAYSVPDVKQAVAFFEGALGATLDYWREVGPFGAEDAVTYAVREGASYTLAKMQLAGMPMELFEYRDTGLSREVAHNAQPGGGHLALLVEDVAAAKARLEAWPGVRMLGEIGTLPPGHMLAGRKWIYFLTPWGQQIELVAEPG